MIIGISKGPSIPEELLRSVEPHFLYSTSRELTTSIDCFVETQLRYINYKIAAKPGSITQHVKKIKLLQGGGLDQEYLFSALIDLFLLLQEKGYELRRRMLLSSQKGLSKLMFARLHVRLHEGGLTGGDHWAGRLSMFPVKKHRDFEVCISEVSHKALGVKRYGI